MRADRVWTMGRCMAGRWSNSSRARFGRVGAIGSRTRTCARNNTMLTCSVWAHSVFEPKRAVKAAEPTCSGKCRARLSRQKRAEAALADIALLALAVLPTADRQAALERFQRIVNGPIQ